MPADPIGRILQHYPDPGQAVADPVRDSPLPVLPGPGAHRQQTRQQLFGVTPGQAVDAGQGKQTVRLPRRLRRRAQNQTQHRRYLVGGRRQPGRGTPPVQENVSLPHRIEQDGQPVGGVEIIVHRLGEPGQDVRVGGPLGRGAAPEGPQALQTGRRLVQEGVGELQGRPVGGAQVEQAQGRPAHPGDGPGQVHQPSRRFGHFLALQVHHPVVEPEVGQGAAVGPLRLGDLVFVVGENQIRPPGVDVERGSQVFGRHRRTFDVPTGTARPPRRLPGGLPRLGRLPQGEVQRVALGLPRLHPGPGPQPVGVAARQLPVALRAPHPEINVPPGRVGQTPLHQPGDQVPHLPDVGGGGRLDVRRGDVQIPKAFPKTGGHRGGQLLGGDPPPPGPVDDFVVHVGDVADVGHLVAAPGQIPSYGVEGDGAPPVPQVGFGLHGGTAHVHLHPPPLQSLQRHPPPPQGVVEVDHNRQANRSAPGPYSPAPNNTVA